MRVKSLADRYRAVRAATEALSAPLSDEDHMVQSMPDASPAKWHLAHTTWFFETFLLGAEPGYRAFDERWGFLFNSYYESLGERLARPSRGVLSRPALSEVRSYRAHVDERMARLLEARGDELAPVAALGLAHEEQHQELFLTDVKHHLFANPLRPAYLPPRARATVEAARLEWRAFDGGVHEVGDDGRAFAFDNERPRHRTLLAPFALASRLVTAGEYAAFIEDGGYSRPTLWLADGWDAARAGAWTAPLYWERSDAGWTTFTLRGLRPLDPSEPLCHVSYYEADAFARWAGARLPTEHEWEVAAVPMPVAGNFADSGELHPLPEGDAPHFYGNAWAWTQSAYSPYPGYRPDAGALGEYNGKFMVNQLVLRGGSCATPPGHARATYRNFFAPDKRWQFTGIRLAKDR